MKRSPVGIRRPTSSTGANRDRTGVGGFGASVWILFAVVISVLDQASKHLMLATLTPGDAVAVTPFFNLVLGLNRGAAFGFLSEANGWQRPVLLAVATGMSGLLVNLIRRSDSNPLERFGCCLILGGAIGNIVDRTFRGAVVDWLDFHLGGCYWPAFNLADATVTVGVCALLAGGTFSGSKKSVGGLS